jgi:plasmid stabilization system protein ParE
MVIWSVPAKLDLRAIHDYIKLESDFYAKKVVDELIELSESLNSLPERGRIVPEFGDSKVRELFIYSYRLLYEIDEEEISILAVIHGKRDISSMKVEDLK